MTMLSSPWLTALQWGLLAFFIVPLIEAAMALIGAAWARFGYAQAPGKFAI